MAKYKDKWKTTFPTSIGNQTRPEDSVDNTQEYNTDGLPQYMANDPVRYDLQNAVNSQLVSNDERLNEKIKRTSDDLAAHNKDPKAHATGIAGNAATASKLLTPRTISLTGKAAGSTSFDGSSNASINVTSVNADTASKLSTARKINITGDATGAANFDGSGDISINTTVNESKHAVNADNAGHANNVTDAVINYGVSGVGEGTTAMASGVISNLSGLTGSNDLTSMNKLRSFVGSVSNNQDWYDVISVRHRNGSEDGQNFGLLMYSGLTNTDSIKYKKQPGSSGWTEERTILDSSNYNSYVPTKTGAGASGSWNINSATATKLQTPRTISLTGNASGSANFDGSGNISINTNVNNSAHAEKAKVLDGFKGLDNGNWGLTLGNVISGFQEAGGGSIQWRANDGRIYQKVDGTHWQREGAYEVIDTSTVNNYAPTKTGSGASGTWPISISGTAAKADGLTSNLVFPDIGNVGTSNKISWSGSTDGADIYYQTTASDQGNLVLNLRDDDNCYLRIACNGAFKSYFSPSNGNFHGNVNGNADTATNATHASSANSATNADTVDGIHAASLFYNKGNWASDNWATIGTYQVNGNPPVSDAYGWGQVISSSTNEARFQLYASDNNNNGRLRYRTGWDNKDHPWNTILDSENYNLFAPTKTGGGASGTWGINISGNADTVDGYHASDLFRHLGGNQTPVITDIFDRAGTIDMTTMSAADKATHKANINKARNATQDIWNTDTGISAYGGDYDMANGYRQGSLKLTQSYKNFDKILVVGANDKGEFLIYKLWDVWALANAFAGGSRFQLFHGGDYWFLYGSAKKGTWAGYVLSTDTVWSCQDQNSGIVAIYGIKY